MEQRTLLEKWLSGNITEQELKEFQSQEDYALHKDIIEGAQSFQASNFAKVKSFDSFKKDMPSNNKTKVISINRYRFIARIAAIFILAFGLYFVFENSNITSVESLASQSTQFELPDASEVVLNASSKIKFNEKSWTKERKVNLNGEAYFRVAKGSKFDVKTAQGVVSVLGTQFTVKQRDDYFEVKCFEGIVKVDVNGTSHKLTIGKTLRLLDGILTLNTTTKNKPEWLNNISNFDSVPLSEVIKELERQYAISIKAQNINQQRIITGGFVHDNLEQALTSVLVPLELDYKKNSKNNIIIYKK